MILSVLFQADSFEFGPNHLPGETVTIVHAPSSSPYIYANAWHMAHGVVSHKHTKCTLLSRPTETGVWTVWSGRYNAELARGQP